ncbi:hypothetical protein J6590_017722 [Homalodisca vitripennis]|nr:hypothetical protein J6590_017722 [Homalodisca vitripennis]
MADKGSNCLFKFDFGSKVPSEISFAQSRAQMKYRALGYAAGMETGGKNKGLSRPRCAGEENSKKAGKNQHTAKQGRYVLSLPPAMLSDQSSGCMRRARPRDKSTRPAWDKRVRDSCYLDKLVAIILLVGRDKHFCKLTRHW